jgi:hypothetical protein
MSEGPLQEALREIAPDLDASMEPLITALRAGQPVEDAWEHLLKEALDEA